MRTSLRSEPVQQVNLFAFLDIVFTATGVLMVIGVFFSLSPRLEKITREPEVAADILLQRKELESAITTWRKNEALAAGATQLSRVKPEPAALTAAAKSGLAAVDPDALLLDETALAANNRPLQQLITELETATVRRLEVASKAEKTWLTREQSLLEQQRKTRRLLVRPDQSPSLKEVLLMVVTADAFDVQRMERPDLRLRVAAPWTDAARDRLLARFDPTRQRFLIFFKPSGADYFETVRNALKRVGYDVGYEPVPEEYSVSLHPDDDKAPLELIR